MPLFATLTLNFILGAVASLAAARELRASPRAVHQARSFRALAMHEIIVAVPIAAFLLLRFGDWALSYTADGAHLPSALLALLILLHGGVAMGGFVLGAKLVRDHRARWVRILSVAAGISIVLAALVFRDRLGTVATFAQFRGGFGLQSFWRTALVGATLGLGLAWAGAATHLLWSLARRI